MVRSHAFPRVVLAPEELLPALEHRGECVEAARTSERLAAKDGGAGALELDLATDRPARLELVDVSTDPAGVVTVRFESWRAVDGVHVPQRVVAVDARGEWVMELASLELTWRGGAAAGG